MTILQSWAQGQECWGDHGMEKLWGSANIRVYGGGGADPNFLERLSKMVGEYDIQSNSVSYNEGKRGTSQQTQRHNIFDVSALAALPAGRAVVLSSGQPATLVKTVPWFTRPDAGTVKASLAKYDPGAATNIPVSNNPWVASLQPALQQRGPERPVWEQNEGNNTGGW
jgi:type IV secretory pathway TraG/TraD family ATPase VirD4